MAFDAVLTINGLSGGNRAGDTVSIESFSWGLAGRDASTGLPVGRRNYTPLVITKVVDATSPVLFLNSLTGKVLPTVQVVCRPAKGGKNDKQEFLVYKLSDVVISSVTTSGNRHGGDFPMEEIEFTFLKLEMSVG